MAHGHGEGGPCQSASNLPVLASASDAPLIQRRELCRDFFHWSIRAANLALDRLRIRLLDFI